MVSGGVLTISITPQNRSSGPDTNAVRTPVQSGRTPSLKKAGPTCGTRDVPVLRWFALRLPWGTQQKGRRSAQRTWRSGHRSAGSCSSKRRSKRQHPRSEKRRSKTTAPLRSRILLARRLKQRPPLAGAGRGLGPVRKQAALWALVAANSPKSARRFLQSGSE
jgi:hypothetical protein